MARVQAIMRAIASIFLGTFATIASFGIILSLVWAVVGDFQSVKLIGTLISAALAICLGGVVVAWFEKNYDRILPFVFGFLFGGLSFAYILGFDLLVPVLASLSALAAGAGGFLFRHMYPDGRTAVGFDAD